MKTPRLKRSKRKSKQEIEEPFSNCLETIEKAVKSLTGTDEVASATDSADELLLFGQSVGLRFKKLTNKRNVLEALLAIEQKSYEVELRELE